VVFQSLPSAFGAAGRENNPKTGVRPEHSNFQSQ